MNRREFLKTLIALGASITLPVKLSDASESDLARIWDDETCLFEVQEYGTLWVADFIEPSTRSDAYGYLLSDLQSTGDLIEFSERSTLAWRLQNVYEDHLDHLGHLSVSGETAAIRRNARRRLKKLPDDPDYGWQKWLEREPAVAREACLSEADAYLSEAPDWSEWESLPDEANAQGAAYRYFCRHENPELLDRLGIMIVEGDHPGSSYFAAELTIPVDEANRIARTEGLPYRFRDA